MGIDNLLKELRPITNTHCHVSQFEGQTCAVDASCWLHRASYSCALQLVTGKGTTKYLNFLLRCIRLFQHHRVSLIVVFDGAQLPMKRGEEQKRRALREENKAKALQAMNAGDRESAWKYASQAVRVTNEMVTAFMNQCIANGVPFVCAPFEADAQLAHLYRNGECDAVITEDSDLLLFGVGRAFYKLDVNSGYGHLLDMSNIQQYTASKTDLCAFLKKSRDLQRDLIKVCVLSGCDYVESLPGIGLKTAVKLCKQFKRTELMLHSLVLDKHESAPPDYRLQFTRATLTFLHQTVYSAREQKLIHLTPIDEDAMHTYYQQVQKYYSKRSKRGDDDADDTFDASMDFLGTHCEPNIARSIAEGALDARSLQPRQLTSTNNNQSSPPPPSSTTAKKNGDENMNIFGIMQSASKAETSIGSSAQNKKRRNCSTAKKKQKYFQPSSSCADNDGEACSDDNDDDGLQTKLDDLMQEFGVTTEIESDCNEACTEIIHQPLRKQNRNRKRTRMAIESMDAIISANHSPIVNRARKRKLNNGSIQSAKTLKTPTTTAAVASEQSDNDGGSLIMDLCRSRKTKKTEAKTSVVEENEADYNKENVRCRNPFSVTRKNAVLSRKSIAMIGAVHKPMQNENEDENKVCDETASIASSDDQHEAPHVKTHAMNEAFYDIESDDGNDDDAVDSTAMQSTELSLRESDRETDKLLRAFQGSQHIQEQKDADSEDDEDDDDIQVLSNEKDLRSDSVSIKKIVNDKTATVSNDKSKPKSFKPPRLSKAKTKPNLQPKKKAKTNGNTKNTKNNTKNKTVASKSSKQLTLTAYFRKK
mmetsp:Transcript_24989/g.40478  ORF Transcript_24989/g.40478 Transcript_24989/m.40478 type:complete len:818 (+) Transcript_24989:68-2521(+)